MTANVDSSHAAGHHAECAADGLPGHHARQVKAVIIGAGQAGLSAAHELKRRGFEPGEDVLILDSNDGPGGAWRHRWDSLTFGAAHGINDLPGLTLEDVVPDANTNVERPASDIVTTYYGAYEEKFNLQVVRAAKVVDVREVADHVARPGEAGDSDKANQSGERPKPLRVTALIDDVCHIIDTQAVLSATGTWDSPFVPYIPGIEKFEGRQLHTASFANADEFAGQKMIVVGGGLSAVQFLLQLRGVANTVWATRRPPNFTHQVFGQTWGLEVERAVRARTHSGERPSSVVRTTGIPQIPAYLEGVEDGTLISRGMFNQILPDGVRFGGQQHDTADGLGPSASDTLALPQSWQPFEEGHVEKADVIFWNTGFRHSLTHLAPLRLRERSAAAAAEAAGSDEAKIGSGITMADEVRITGEPRVFLVGYGSNASTIGATRGGRRAGQAAARFLNELA